MPDQFHWRVGVAPEPYEPLDRRDLYWGLLLLLIFVLALAISWQRWGDLVIDRGREMNTPLRLARGEMLYSDVRFNYAPLSPYFNAALYKLFGVSLAVIYTNGIITTTLILGLVLWLARRLMRPAAATLATLGVLWLCAFKPSGNFIFPYAFSALHGCALGLVALVLLVQFVETEQKRFLFAASLVAGIALVTKTEYGFPALLAGVAAVGLTSSRSRVATMGAITMFVALPLAIAAATYSFLAARVGWPTLIDDSYLFLTNVPVEVVHFNLWKSGFDRPLLWFGQMLLALLRLLGLAGMMASVCLLVAVRLGAGRRERLRWAGVLLLGVLIFFGGAIVQGDLGPFLAMPLILAVLIVLSLFELQRPDGKAAAEKRSTVVLTVMAVYALGSLARVILRVPSGGAYGSYFLPVSLVLFTYLWVELFPRLFGDLRARRWARGCALGLILLSVAGTAARVAYQYRSKDMSALRTARGTMVARPNHVQAFQEAIALIEHQTRPDEFVAVVPEGTALHFFSDRRSPLRDEIVTPGFLDAVGEERAIARLEQTRTQLVLVANRPTKEYTQKIFGRDYYQRLMIWIEEHYEVCAILGPDKRPDIAIGDPTFFFRAYCLRP